MSAPQNSTFKNLAALWRTFKKYRVQIITLVVLGIVSATLDGIGINAMIPLISFFTNASSGPTDFISRTLQAFFSFLHVPFTFRFLLGFILGLFIVRAVTVALFGYVRGRISADFMGVDAARIMAVPAETEIGDATGDSGARHSEN